MVDAWIKINKKRIWYGFALFLTTILVILYFVPMNFPSRVQRAQALMNEIYQDEQEIYLAENVTIHKIQDLMNVTNRLAGDVGQDLQTKANLALCKFRNLQKIKYFVDSQHTDINNPKLEQVSLNAELSPELWAKHKDLYVWPVQDAFTQQIDHIYELVEEAWLPLNQAHQLVNDLADLPAKDNQQVLKQVQTMLNIEELLNQAADQGLKEKINQQYLQKVDHYMQSMLQDPDKFSDQILSNLYQADAVLPYIMDTPLDYRPKVAVTFDDGPNEDFTPQILDILDKYQIKATFFVVGRNVDQVPQVAQEINARGHDIGNHSYSHPTFLEMTDDEILWEINATQDIIENHTGYRPKLYRMPFGDGGRHVYELIDNMTSTMWNTDTNDWYFETPEEIYEYTLPQFDRDMLMLMHDTSQKSVDAFEQILQALVDQNYKFVSPNELEFNERYREIENYAQYE